MSEFLDKKRASSALHTINMRMDDDRFRK